MNAKEKKALYNTRWREANKDRYKALVKKSRDKLKVHKAGKDAERCRANREFVQELKESSPCADCGEFYPFFLMDFDHIGPKCNNIPKLLGGSRDILLREIAKCELVCAMCHRVRSYERMVIQ